MAMAAGLATLSRLDDSVYEGIETSSAALERGLRRAAADAGAATTLNRVGSMLTLFHSPETVTDYDSALRCDTDRFATWWCGMLDRGVFLPPSQFEALFVGAAHSAADIDQTVVAAKEVLAGM